MNLRDDSPPSQFLGVEPIGSWDAVHVPGDRSIVPLPGESAPFPELSTSASTYFVSMFPTLQLNVTRDCAWWMRVLPTGPESTSVTMGFLFPSATAAMPDFDSLVKQYLYRWDLAVQEDNDISVNQQLATESPFHKPGPYHPLEFAVHRFDNMVVDAVLEGEAPRTDAFTATETVTTRINNLHSVSSASSGARLMSSTTGPSRLAGMPSSRALSGGIAGSDNCLPPGASVCVTGATGFIALHLVEQLLTAGCLMGSRPRARAPTHSAFEAHPGNYARAAGIASQLRSERTTRQSLRH